MDTATFLDVFEGVPLSEISKVEIENGVDIIGALAEKTGFLKSNGEARRALKENAISVNKEKVSEGYSVSYSDLINGPKTGGQDNKGAFVTIYACKRC